MTEVPYQVVFATSEEIGSSARLLHLPGSHHNAHAGGWASARFCTFPQDVVLRFSAPCSLKMLKLLSHEFRIATKVELFIGSVPAGTLPPFAGCDGVEFETLGHFCFDCNDRSRWRARELKTIYLPKVAEGMYLKLRLDVCHLNERNLYSQVGLVSIHAFGHGLGAELNLLADRLSDHDAIDAFMAASRPSAAIQAAKEIAFSDAAWRMQDPLSEQIAAGKVVSKGTAEAHRRAAEKHQATVAAHAATRASGDYFGVGLTQKVRLEKEAAAREDDFERASQLKERENELAQVGAQLAELERKKSEAVQLQRYQLAGEIKAELHALRTAHGIPHPLPAAKMPAEPGLPPPLLVRARITPGCDIVSEYRAAHERRAMQQRIEEMAMARLVEASPRQPTMSPRDLTRREAAGAKGSPRNTIPSKLLPPEGTEEGGGAKENGYFGLPELGGFSDPGIRDAAAAGVEAGANAMSAIGTSATELVGAAPDAALEAGAKAAAAGLDAANAIGDGIGDFAQSAAAFAPSASGLANAKSIVAGGAASLLRATANSLDEKPEAKAEAKAEAKVEAKAEAKNWQDAE